MKRYKEILVENIDSETIEILIALLPEAGFTGFEEEANSLKAFAGEADFNAGALNEIVQTQNIRFVIKDIEEQNWNALWESNFDPVVVDDFVVIRAHFHHQRFDTQHEIIITPKMSFGTGHHATTFMMIQQMRELDFIDKKVFDFGTGTGVLAILAAQSGAKEIIAIDNDDWSVENTLENIQKNKVAQIQVKKAHTAAVDNSFDITLANINKNVIIANAEILAGQVNKGGYLLLSGLLAEDEHDIFTIFSNLGMQRLNTQQRAQWISMLWTTK